MSTFQSIPRALSVLAIALFVLAPLAGAQKKDVVALKGGKSESGKITSEDHGGVTIEIKAGQTKTIPWAEVQSIDYTPSAGFSEAMQAVREGKIEDAIAELEELKANGKLRPVLQQQVLFHLANTKQRAGKTDEAIAGYKELIEAFPKGRYLRNAGENWINAMLAKDDKNGAEEALSKLTFGAQGVEGFQVDLALLKGRVLEAKGSFSEARNAYQSAEQSAGSNTALVQEAQLGRARTLAGEGKGSEAEGMLRTLTKDGATNAILAGAWNGLGEMVADEARKKRSIEQLTDALYMHLRGVVQYAPLPGEPTREYERALAGASRCFKFISELETSSERKRSNKARSDENLAKLKKDFPNSQFLRGL